MIVLFTDFGHGDPYVGQMQAVLYREAPGVPVVSLLNDAPVFDPLAAAYLLAAYVEEFPQGTIFLCVVDPGVGSAQRRPVMVNMDGCWFVGPDNGLFEVAAHRSGDVTWWDIQWRPEHLSHSFHGRDLFAPVAARLARGEMPRATELDDRPVFSGPDDYPYVIYCDHFGNAMTGLRASLISEEAVLYCKGHELQRQRTFSDVPVGKAFWYENANGLVEMAVNQGSAVAELGLVPGDEVKIKEG
jgi:S-adenosylmethionine hydrolase